MGNQNHKGEYSTLKLIPNSARPEGKGGESSFQSLEERATMTRAVVFSGETQPCGGNSDLTLLSPSDLLLGLSIAKPKCKPESKRAHWFSSYRSAFPGRKQGRKGQEWVWREKRKICGRELKLAQFIKRKCGDLNFLHYFLNTQFHLPHDNRHKNNGLSPSWFFFEHLQLLFCPKGNQERPWLEHLQGLIMLSSKFSEKPLLIKV